MEPAAIFTGVSAILVAAGGVVLTVREFRRRDRRESEREIEAMSADLHHCRQVLIAWRRYAFVLRERLADHGHDIPEPPEEQV